MVLDSVDLGFRYSRRCVAARCSIVVVAVGVSAVGLGTVGAVAAFVGAMGSVGRCLFILTTLASVTAGVALQQEVPLLLWLWVFEVLALLLRGLEEWVLTVSC